MSSVYPSLVTLRDSLAAVPGVKTSKIGLEANMTPDDYPIVRIVPGRVADDEAIGRQGVEVKIYFGQPIHEASITLEGEWQALLAMADTLRTKAEQTAGISFYYRDTLLDEDRLEAYKLMMIRGTVVA